MGRGKDFDIVIEPFYEVFRTLSDSDLPMDASFLWCRVQNMGKRVEEI